MKKILIICFLACSLSMFAQEKPHKCFCEIVGTGNITGTKVKVEIDFGQAKSFWGQHKDRFLVDEKGNKIKFNSMVDAMNYMAKFGWVFEQAYVITEKGISDQNVYHFLLSKDITSDEEIMEGIVTAKDVASPSGKERKSGDDLYY